MRIERRLLHSQLLQDPRRGCHKVDSVRAVARTVQYSEGLGGQPASNYIEGEAAWADVVVPWVFPLEDVIPAVANRFAVFSPRRRSDLLTKVSVEGHVSAAARLDASVQVSRRQSTRMAP